MREEERRGEETRVIERRGEMKTERFIYHSFHFRSSRKGEGTKRCGMIM